MSGGLLSCTLCVCVCQEVCSPVLCVCVCVCVCVPDTLDRYVYWSGLPIPFPGDLPNPGMETGSLALQAESLPTEISGKS